MPNYKLNLSKNQKKYSIVIKAENETDLKEKVHKEWYSILSVELIDKLKVEWNKYYFKWLKDWAEKSWIIIWKDIFKVYLRLKKFFWYEIIEIYPEWDKDVSKEEKQKILRVLQDSYEIYNKNLSKKTKIIKDYENEKTSLNQNTNFDKFYLKKQLEEIHSFIEFVIEKIDNLLKDEKIKLSIDEEVELKNYRNNIFVLKKTTNIEKLKEIWEKTLLKIWEIELIRLEKEKDKYYRDLLKWTNKMLKTVWSQKQFIEKSRDIKYQVTNFFKNLIEQLKPDESEVEEEKNNNFIDKKSYSYLKTSILLMKYKNRLRKNNIEIIKNFYLFFLPFMKNDKKENLLIKKKVILQNISILKAKLWWKRFSYTKVKTAYDKFISVFLDFFISLRNTIFVVIYIYIICFLIYINLWLEINFNWIYYFIYLLLFYFFMLLTRGVLTLTLNIVFFYFIIIFWIVNF